MNNCAIVAPSFLISEHEPRKGTETLPWHNRLIAAAAKISEHEPRKGTETTAGAMPTSRSAQISEHDPRKGTETYK